MEKKKKKRSSTVRVSYSGTISIAFRVRKTWPTQRRSTSSRWIPPLAWLPLQVFRGPPQRPWAFPTFKVTFPFLRALTYGTRLIGTLISRENNDNIHIKPFHVISETVSGSVFYFTPCQWNSFSLLHIFYHSALDMSYTFSASLHRSSARILEEGGAKQKVW